MNNIFSDQVNSELFRNQQPSNKIIILGLAQHITETDVSSLLVLVTFGLNYKLHIYTDKQ